MKTLIIDNHSKHLSEIVQIFPNSKVVSHENLLPDQDLSLFNLLVISGGSGVPTVKHHENYYGVEEQLVRSSPIPVLGICLGAEIIVTAFSGELAEISTLHKGEMELQMQNESLQKALHHNPCIVYEAHSVLIQKLPENFIVQAESKHGIEVFKHATRPILGIQFHPEVGKHDDLWNWIFDQLNVRRN